MSLETKLKKIADAAEQKGATYYTAVEANKVILRLVRLALAQDKTIEAQQKLAASVLRTWADLPEKERLTEGEFERRFVAYDAAKAALAKLIVEEWT